MAGIGIKLNKIYDKHTITTNLVGAGYSVLITIAPLLWVILAVVLMQYLLGFSKVGYAGRELFSCTVLYIFIFSLLTVSPFNAVLSRYLSDVFFWEKYDDILPCFYLGLFFCSVVAGIIGIPFCIHERIVGRVDLLFVLTGYLGFFALMLCLYTMLYLLLCKAYKEISRFFFLGMTVTVILSLILGIVFHVETTYAMLVSLTVGIILIAILEYALLRSYFRVNSGNYKDVLNYMKLYWKLIPTNFLYTLGIYIHAFVFWASDMHLVVARSFVCMTSYDMATGLALMTNLSSTVILISRVEMHFHEKYKRYSEAVIGGRRMDIENAKGQMFEQLSDELMSLVRIQFIISAVLFFAFMCLMPLLGFGGLVMQIYPCMAAGYFIMFIMYAAIIFLYYFNDLDGALLTSAVFAFVTLVAAVIAVFLSPIWYGIGLFIGALAGWSVAYFRLHYLEKHMDEHVFCGGNIMRKVREERPDNKVFDRKLQTETGKENAE